MMVDASVRPNDDTDTSKKAREKGKASDGTNLLDGVLFPMVAMVLFVRYAMAWRQRLWVLSKVLAKEVSERTLRAPMDRP